VKTSGAMEGEKGVVRVMENGGGEEQSTLEPINIYWNFFTNLR